MATYKVADISLAAYGRKEIELAEREMPGYVKHKNKPRRLTATLATKSEMDNVDSDGGNTC
jgi:S-adenosylhomocysteine hydrolase